MNFDQRKSFIEKMLVLEENFPVETWKINGIDIWPVLKIEIWFYFLRSKSIKKKPVFKRIIINTIKWYIRVKAKIHARKFLKGLPKEPVDAIFNGGKSYRIDFRNQNINRYYHPIFEWLNKSSIDFLSFEFQADKPRKDSINLTDMLPYFYARPAKISTENLESYDAFKSEISHTLDIDIALIDTLINKCYNSILPWYKLYTFLIKKYKPKVSIGLCYYSYPMFAMNAACAHLGVKSVDIQHGLQGAMAIAYTFKKKSHTYNTLPREFWCWDDQSINHIQKWSNQKYTTRLSGNPWINYLMQHKASFINDIKSTKPIILFTCQIHPQPILDGYLIEAIHQSKDAFDWWIRLHPRTTEAKKAELLTLLGNHQLLDHICLNDASAKPLLSILLNCHCHISKYSGSVLESVLLNVKTIVLEKIGCEAYDHFIANDQAIGLLEPDSESILREINKPFTKINSEESIDFEHFLKDQFKNKV